MRSVRSLAVGLWWWWWCWCWCWCCLCPPWQVAAVGGKDCPWEQNNLKKWSNPSTWGSNGVPTNDSEVVINGSMRVLLDVSTEHLATLTIEAGGVLIWDNVTGLELHAHYIWVKGEFHMGSPTCRLQVKAHIKLYGNSSDKYNTTEHEFGRKFLGVAPGGVLELHGKEKTSWTKLAQTVQPVHKIKCGMVYDHYDPKTNYAKTYNQQGVNVIIWNENGTLVDFSTFKEKDYGELPRFFETVPNDTIVGMFTYSKPWLGSKTKSLESFVRTLGGELPKDASSKDGFALLAKKGSKSTAKQFLEKDLDEKEVEAKSKDRNEFAPLRFLSYHDKDKQLVFQVAENFWTVLKSQMFRVLDEDVAFPKLNLTDKVKGWEAGDEVLLTSTDFEWQQAEVRTLVKCEDCNPKQVRVNESMRYMHYGKYTYNVDEKGEVAMISRNIVIEGVVEDECPKDNKKDKEMCERFHRDTFGGHLMVVRGFKSVHIQGVKLYHMGQQRHKGAYSLHFHMCDDVNGTFLRDNTVFDSFSRCFTVHGTNCLQIENNVCFKHIGHGLFLEDSVEQNNTIKGNLIAGTVHGRLLLSDKDKADCKGMESNCDALSSYWLTHPNNEVVGNVAAGGDGNGFMYVFADQPLGPSLQRQKELNRTHHPKDMPLNFSHNVAHSNRVAGVHMDEKISTGTGMENKGKVEENGVLRCENEYYPHINGKPVWTEMTHGTYYKNGMKNMWVKGGNIRIAYSTLADSKEGLTGGTTLTDTGTEAYRCIFVGETDNVGTFPVPKKTDRGTYYNMTRSYCGDPSITVTAVSLYQGPIFVNSCFFDQYNPMSWCMETNTTLANCSKDKVFTRPVGAISFKRDNAYPTMTSSYTVNNTFSFCDNEDGRHWVYQGPDSRFDWDWKDGNKMVYVRDKDGKLTGTVNASIVPNFQLFSGDECQLRMDWGDMLVCPYRYVKLEILGKDGSLGSKSKTDTPLLIRRDDKKYGETFNITGEIRNEFLLRTNCSYLIDFNKKTKNSGFPSEIKLFGYGVEKGDEVRVGLCQPKDVTHFEVTMTYPVNFRNNATWTNSLMELDNDTTGAAFYHDKDNGILFFKMMSNHTDITETEQCPAGKCWKVVIRPGWSKKKPKKSPIRSCFKVDVQPFQGKEEVKQKPSTPPCPGYGSAWGLGAKDWSKKDEEKEDFSMPCLGDQGVNGTYVGCYKEKYGRVTQELKDTEATYLYQTMNPLFCVNRCFYRGFEYAGLARGSRCTCSHHLHDTADFQSNNCTDVCEGDPGTKCGGQAEVSVWKTGL